MNLKKELIEQINDEKKVESICIILFRFSIALMRFLIR